MKKIVYYLRIYGLRKFLSFLFAEAKMVKRGFLNSSFSQNEEDIIIDDYLGNKPHGFYVDIGAYNPTRMSNTKRFYLRGWTGINVEPDPEKFKKFFKFRPKDINLNIGIANKNGKLTYFKFEPDTLSTFSKETANTYQREGLKLVGTHKIKISKLKNVLEKYSEGKQIDFISIDVEGYDHEVLKSNDWKKFKPTLVCIEAGGNFELDSERLLKQVGYTKVCKNHNNLIFLLRE